MRRPVCSPARASILTGSIPSQHGVQDFIRAGNSSLLHGARTDTAIEYLAGQTAYTDLLASHGYSCGLSGKWHLGYSEMPQKSFADWNVHATGSAPYCNAPMITDNALRFLESQKAEAAPFCLNVHYTAPHALWSRELSGLRPSSGGRF